jgi:catechol 2,3-dioxygenase-like lactoylglutathione lyase family enzyme
MSTTEASTTSSDQNVGLIDMKLEIQIIPVSDVDRAKDFYQRSGWRLDDDVAPLEGLRIVQFTSRALRLRSRSARGSPRLRQARPRRVSSFPTSKRHVMNS